jgi:hypothetical protein
MRDIALYNVRCATDDAWPVTWSELAYDLARGRQLGDTFNEWDTTDRAGNLIRVIRHEGFSRDGEPLGGVYVVPR